MENPKKCMKCSNHGTKKCGQCLQVYYCSRDCQMAHWKTHKPSCKPCNKPKGASTEKRKESKNMKRAKTIYVKAGSFDSYDEFDAKTDLFELESYGNEAGEMKEIRSRFGWKDVSGTLYKFYSPNEIDFQWYYYIYYDDTRNRVKRFSDENVFASGCCSSKIYGDVIILRSGPMGSNSYDESISVKDLYDCFEFYQTHNSVKVFQQREYKRCMQSFGVTGGQQPSWQMGESFKYGENIFVSKIL
uniref:MYND-type domain-containing protein n=1 Tax=Clytia hemisphaerica TaxID=252671 RepID=A0A7M5X644_9CNID